MTTYTLDSTQTTVSFAVRGLAPTKGQFSRGTGTITTDERGDPQALEISIATNSLRTGLALRDMHLKTDSFFDARRYPVISYSSRHIERTAENRYIIHGALRLRGRERPVTLMATIDPARGSDGSHRAHVTGIVLRSAFAIPRNRILHASMLAMIGDTVAITADVVASPVPTSSVTPSLAANSSRE
jgi:polyisoprenoid-binding protein YceI